ncbi:class I SAM-dependent methyltransferase [Micromonospora sp. NBRC 101691]|uniref:class I SAM-dependent methyltransferase n=1 Tax=Micromonospora sp. NBRC 101691 TaxID=3032198 RepID=UPI00255689B9|nr:class I SAM-dependent methyltransferase [Micromonospora sp. NBRC 101691]
MTTALPAAATCRWRRDWDPMMDDYLPGRDACLTAGFDAVDQILGRPPSAVLDLGGGPGTTVEAVLRRWPYGRAVLVDVDPVLLALARAALPASASVLRADLGSPAWRAGVGGPYDVALLVMTLHYLPEERVRELYGEIRRVLTPDGVLLVADTVPTTDSSPRPEGTTGRNGTGNPDPWSRWWSGIAGEPALGEPLRERTETMTGVTSAEFVADLAWHRAATLAAGFGACRTVWRSGEHALLALYDDTPRR